MPVEASNENERLVLEFFATLGSGDLEKVRQLLHEQATWTPQVREVPGAGVHRGKRGIVDEFLTPVRGLFRPGDPKVIIDSIASKGPSRTVTGNSPTVARMRISMPGPSRCATGKSSRFASTSTATT
jgi:uncharacterized protein